MRNNIKGNLINCLILLTLIMLIHSCKSTKKVDFDDLIKRFSENEKDSLKLQCLIFIKNNISDVTSEVPSFYSADGKREIFRLDTITSDSSLTSVLLNRKFRFSSRTLKDVDFFSSELLEMNIDNAISDWKKYPWSKDVPKDIFLNYLLPYKVLNENPENWREKLFQKYRDSIVKHEMNGDKNSENLYSGLRSEAWSWLRYTGDFTRLTKSPSLSELLAIKKGQCYELSHLFVYIARSAGIPSTIDLVPMWGKVTGNHSAEVFYGPIKKNNVFIRYGLRPWDPFISPPKVFRISFKRISLWSDSIKPLLAKKEYYIPDFLQSDHILDVTKEYTATSDVIYKFKKRQNIPIAYICVYNYGEWRPLFYGKVFQNGEYAKFNDMAKDMAYHIAVPNGNSYKLSGKPFILDSVNNINYSKPDFKVKMNIVVKRTNIGKEAWVRKGKEYKLKFLDKNNVWKDLESKLCQKDSSLSFKNIPSGSFFMVEDRKDGKNLSRIFLYKRGKQIWY